MKEDGEEGEIGMFWALFLSTLELTKDILLLTKDRKEGKIRMFIVFILFVYRS